MRASVLAMDWLEPSDQGTVELSLSYARQIDLANAAAVAASEALRGLEDLDPLEKAPLLDACNDAVAASLKANYLGMHLLNAMKSLGGDPQSRALIKDAQKSDDDGAPSDPLAAMRAKARGKQGA